MCTLVNIKQQALNKCKNNHKRSNRIYYYALCVVCILFVSCSFVIISIYKHINKQNLSVTTNSDINCDNIILSDISGDKNPQIQEMFNNNQCFNNNFRLQTIAIRFLTFNFLHQNIANIDQYRSLFNVSQIQTMLLTELGQQLYKGKSLKQVTENKTHNKQVSHNHASFAQYFSAHDIQKITLIFNTHSNSRKLYKINEVTLITNYILFFYKLYTNMIICTFDTNIQITLKNIHVTSDDFIM